MSGAQTLKEFAFGIQTENLEGRWGVKIGFANENGFVQKQVDCKCLFFFPHPCRLGAWVGWELSGKNHFSALLSVLTPNQVVSTAKPPWEE